jgi:hypothetical protein
MSGIMVRYLKFRMRSAWIGSFLLRGMLIYNVCAHATLKSLQFGSKSSQDHLATTAGRV